MRAGREPLNGVCPPLFNADIVSQWNLTVIFEWKKLLDKISFVSGAGIVNNGREMTEKNSSHK